MDEVEENVEKEGRENMGVDDKVEMDMASKAPSELSEEEEGKDEVEVKVGRQGRLASQQSIWRVLKVLIVDDVESNRKLLGMLLAAEGIMCFFAKDGAEALEMVRANVNLYDLIFMDNMMPIMTGIEALFAISLP